MVKLQEWENDGNKRPVGEVLTVLDAENTNDAAMKEIMLDAGFPLQFSDEALEVAARIPDVISGKKLNAEKISGMFLPLRLTPQMQRTLMTLFHSGN